MLLCKSKRVIRTKGVPFPESKLSSASAKENFHQLYSKHCFFSYSFSLKLSLVFICRENSRLWGILLLFDCPRFCRLMKTRNRRYPERLGWTGSNLENRERFYFPDASQISAMVTLLPKPGEFTGDRDSQSPITSLNTLYKWFTSSLFEPANEHLETHGFYGSSPEGHAPRM